MAGYEIFVAFLYASNKWQDLNVLRNALFLGRFSLGGFMNIGHFYFLKDKYYERFSECGLLMNKGENHKRPCFYAFQDAKTKLFWLIPLSSKVEKYHRIYERKVANNKKCDTIVFGEFLGKENVFLIQNICPVSDVYVDSEYVVTKEKVPAKINAVLESEIITKAKRVIALARHGVKVVYSDILNMEKDLLRETKLN